MKPLAVAALLLVLLTGCAADPVTADLELVTSTVDPASAPAFLDSPQTQADVINDLDVGIFGVNTESIRYQGEWKGLSVYLGVAGTAGVHIITGTPGDSHSWGSGSTGGNAVIGLDMSADSGLQYLPQGTADIPDGWVVLSDYVIVYE
ncbi:hypothetical protein BH09ACT4_BH09ACT4_18440 [soil metagenome]